MRSLLPIASAPQARGHLLALARPHGRLAVAVALALVGATGAGVLLPPLLGGVVDAVDEGDRGRVDLLVAVLFGLVVLGAALTGLASALVARLGERLLADLREQVVGRALHLPLATLEAAGPGDLLARVGEDVEAISRSLRDAIPTLLVSALTIALTGVGLLALDWRLLLAAGLALPVHVVAARRYLRRSGPLFAAERVALGEQSQQLHDVLSGARAIRARREGPVARARVADASSAALRRSIVALRAGSNYGAQLNAAELVAMAGVLGVGFLLVRADEVSIGAASAAAFYVLRLFGPVMSLLGLLDALQDATASLVRLVGVAQLPAAAPAERRRPGALGLALDDVSFGYRAGREVLHDVSLHVAAGERVALVGVSGAGKTTVARLAAGTHAPDAGRIAVGEVAIESVAPATWRERVALITQEVHVFAGPLAADLRLVAPEASDGDLEAALERVGARDWVRALPEGLATVVGEGGHALSSGQVQHLALARLVLADRPVVLLDEATAEAGSTGAAALEAAAHAATEGRTALIVAHRLSQAASADRVVLMDDGRIVERGTHDELVAARGRYATLWDAWAGHRGEMPSDGRSSDDSLG